MIDAAIPGSDDGRVVSLRDAKRDRKKEDKARAGPPTLEEWQDFFADVVIRSGTDYYVEWAFRDIPEDMVSDREAVKLRLTDEECDKIAKPVAELANKLSWTRKWGRMIIAGSGTAESLVVLGRWFARVNRISMKYRKRIVPGEVIQANVTDRPGQETPEKAGPGPATGYFINPGTG